MKKSLIVVLSVFMVFMFVGVASAGLNDGLVAYYPFNGNSIDESGSGNDGTVNGAILTTDRFGNAISAYSFDGLDDYIEVSDSELLDVNNITLAAWIKLNDLPSGENAKIIIRDLVSGEGTRIFQLNVSPNGQVHFIGQTTQGSGWDIAMYPPNILSVGSWYHVAVTFDDVNGGNLWIDGENVSSDNTFSGSLKIGTAKIEIGGTTHCPCTQNGVLDDIRMYNRALSDGEIKLLHKFADSPPKNMIIELVGVVTSLNLQAGISNSLDTKLDNAFKALDDLNDNNDGAAVNKINAFINEVEAQRGSKISDEDADTLISIANAIIAKILG